MAILNSLTGVRAAGTALVTASGSDVSLPRNRYALPVIEGQQRPDRAVKVAEGPNDDGSWTVTSDGTAVSMFSNIGGAIQNLEADTELMFDPPIAGLESIVVSVPFIGGITGRGFGFLKDLVMTEHIGALPVDLARSEIKGFPAALVTFVDFEPVDSSTVSARSPRESRLGTRKNLYKLTYQITIICEKSESDHARRAYGLEIMDQIAELLVDKHAIDGEHISNPSGIRVIRAWRDTRGGPAFQKYYVYCLLVDAMTTFQRADTRSYSDWVTTYMDVDKQLDGETDLRLVDEVIISMTGVTGS
jgi:hypothetical protein